MATEYHLAQANIAHMRAPLEDPLMAGFVALLDPINQLADESPGFVWRLQTDDGDATSVRAFENPLIFLNMSVWESLAALHDYVYRRPHRHPLRSRRDWFHPLPGPTTVMWWVEAGAIPSVEDAKTRLDLLAANGPIQEAFTFARPFPPPMADLLSDPEKERLAETCEI